MMAITRVNPDGMTLTEAQEVMRELPGLMNSIADEAQQLSAQPVDANEAAISGYKNQIIEQLKATGMSASDARIQAGLYESRIRRRSEIRGQQAADIMAERPLSIQRQEDVVSDPEAMALNQGDLTLGTFYSKLQKTVNEKMGNSATVDQVKAITRDMKPEEVKWSGIEEFLKGKEKVNKAELQEFLAANQLQIEEVVGKDANVADVTKEEAIDLIDQGVNIVYKYDDGYGERPLTRRDLEVTRETVFGTLS